MLFVPGEKSNSYGILTDSGFRVNVPEDSHLHSWLTVNMEAIETESLCLYVTVTNTEKAFWEFGEVDSHTTEWQSFSYGLRAVEGKVLLKRKKAR